MTPSELIRRLVKFNAAFEIPDPQSRHGFDALDTHFGGFGAQREAKGPWRQR